MVFSFGQVVTKEALGSGRRRQGVITLEQLFSHRVHGVDNTGNVRVWPAEQVLLHVLLSGYVLFVPPPGGK